MAGIQIDGVNNKIDFDDDADTSISSATDDTLVVEVGGNTLATVTATSVTVNDGVEITTADNTDTLTLTSTDADANAGPNLRLYRNSSSAAPNDVIGVIEIEGRNDNSEDIIYQQWQYLIADETDGTEDGYFLFNQMRSGTLTERFRIETGTFIINDPGNDFDFRIESDDDTHCFFIDASSDVVLLGSGTDYSSSKLQVTHPSGFGNSTNIAYFKNEESSGTIYGLTVQFRNQAPDNQTSILQSWQDSSAIRARCFADGDFQNHDNAYGSLSDERIKQDIRDSNSQWDDIKALKVRNFKKKDDVRQYGNEAWEQIGVIAQELEDAGMDKLVRHSDPTEADIASDPSFGTIDEDGNITVNEQVKGVNYSVLYMKAIKALQEAMTRIETLEAEVTALKGE